MNIPVFDLHCDTALTLLGETRNEAGSLKKNELHIDLERAAKLEAYCQCFACFTTPMMQEWNKLSPIVIFERELATIQREVDKNKGLIAMAYSMAEVEANREKGKMSALLTIEGPAGFDFDPELLENLYQIGFRASTLGWNEQNVLTGSNVTGGGLTDRGREYLKEAQRLGMLVDVSHISDEAFWDIMDCTQAPVIASHSNSRALCGHSRNLTDDMFRAICRTGGVAGINQFGEFLGEAPTLDTVCDHIFHFLDLDPTGKHIALGGDLDGCEKLSQGFEGVQSYPILADRLVERGLDESMVRDIFWNNARNVFRSVER
ncbi:MAG: membrane dipeptidase [Candidatus Faecousia sp.]|nr:membrane dipeptidase [Candidatus Faecousia sp.]